MSTLQDLLAKVEAAEGPDRAIDREIGFALAGWFTQPLDIQIPPSTLNMIHIPDPDGGYAIVSDHPGSDYPAFTESLDDALALVAKMFGNDPYWQTRTDTYRMALERQNYKNGHKFFASCCPENWTPANSGMANPPYATGATAPLALLAALLKALISQEQQT